MAKSEKPIEVYIEAGKKKTFACAVEWPGWSRSGKDEESALRALADYGSRYAKVAKMAKMAFNAPDGPQDFKVVERLEGNATTDFGAPGRVPSADERLVDVEELARLQALLAACHQALDEAARTAEDKALRKGARGGGRELEEILRHVADAGDAYLLALGWKPEKAPLPVAPLEVAKQTRLHQAVTEGLAAAVRGEIPAQGPRGGKRWSPRYFARRSAWHILDHAWEIEDRVE